MNSGHAPGKWRVFAVFADAEVRDSDDKLIAALPSKTGARYARLIASAPDLLAERDRLKAANELMEALDVLVDVLDDEENNAPEHRRYVEGAWKVALNEARATLEKHQKGTP